MSRFRADLDRVADEITDTTGPDAVAAGLVAAAISERAPRRTGRLAQSVRSGLASPAGGYVVVEAEYGGVIEGGWPARNITAQPYFDPGITAAEPLLAAVYEEHNDQALRHMELHY